MSVKTIKDKLIEKLEDMQHIKGVYSWETSNPDGKYPLATLTIADGEGEFASTAHNFRRRGYRLMLYQEQMKSNQGPENAEAISVKVLDELEEALDMDTTLSGTCKYVQPARWRGMYRDRDVDTRVLEVLIDAFEVVDSS